MGLDEDTQRTCDDQFAPLGCVAPICIIHQNAIRFHEKGERDCRALTWIEVVQRWIDWGVRTNLTPVGRLTHPTLNHSVSSGAVAPA